MPHAFIKAVAAHIPGNVVNPDQYLKQIDAEQYGIASDFVTNTCGIKQLRRFDEGLTAEDTAVKACLDLFDSLSGEAEPIDTVIYCGMRRDYCEPSTAHFVAKTLGLVPNHCFDVSNACMSFASAIQLVEAGIKSGLYKNVLICSSERHEDIARDAVTRINRETFSKKEVFNMTGAFTMGDAAVAMLVSARDHVEQFHYSQTRSLPRHTGLCHYHDEAGEFQFHMEMSTISIRTLALLEKMMGETYQGSGWNKDDVDVLLTHQIGVKPFDRTLEIANVTRAQTIETYPWLGNVASCTIPVCMNAMLMQGRLKPNDHVLVYSTGSGISATEMMLTMNDCAYSKQPSDLAHLSNVEVSTAI